MTQTDLALSMRWSDGAHQAHTAGRQRECRARRRREGRRAQWAPCCGRRLRRRRAPAGGGGGWGATAVCCQRGDGLWELVGRRCSIVGFKFMYNRERGVGALGEFMAVGQVREIGIRASRRKLDASWTRCWGRERKPSTHTHVHKLCAHRGQKPTSPASHSTSPAATASPGRTRALLARTCTYSTRLPLPLPPSPPAVRSSRALRHGYVHNH